MLPGFLPLVGGGRFWSSALPSVGALPDMAVPAPCTAPVAKAGAPSGTDAKEWTTATLPSCHHEEGPRATRPTRLQGIHHLITFKGMLSSYVVGTTALGYYMAPGPFDWRQFAWTCGGTALTVLSANAWNQIYEVDTDAKMHRTAGRYLPQGGCMYTAVAFAVVTGVAGGLVLDRKVNRLAAAQAVSNIALYGAVYTPLKQMHWSNTWVGSIVGAIPPMIGWAGKTGGAELGSWVLGGLLFYWQMPHFMAISWKNGEDYENGGYKMLVNSDRSAVPGVAFRNSLPLLALAPLAYYSGMTTKWIFADASVVTLYAVYSSVPFLVEPSLVTARNLFISSLKTLPLMMGFLIAHRTSSPERAQATVDAIVAFSKAIVPAFVSDALKRIFSWP